MIQGVWTALPNLWNGTSPDLVERTVNGLMTRGIDGMLALGTTGRGAELTLPQRMQALEELVRAVGDGKRIVAAISANPAADVKTLLEHAASVGIKGVAITPPFYSSWTNSELLDWIEAAVGTGPRSVEIYLYQIPSAVRNDWQAEILTQVDQRIGIAGIKDSSGDIQQLIQYLAWGRDRTFSVMVGNERLTTYCLLLGGSGIVSGLSTAYPELLVQAYAACQHKDWDAAAALQHDINRKLDQFAQVSARRTGDVLLELAHEHGVL